MIHQLFRRRAQHVDPRLHSLGLCELVVVIVVIEVVTGEGALVRSVVDHRRHVGRGCTHAHRGRIVEQQIEIDVLRHLGDGGRSAGDRHRALAHDAEKYRRNFGRECHHRGDDLAALGHGGRHAVERIACDPRHVAVEDRLGVGHAVRDRAVPGHGPRLDEGRRFPGDRSDAGGIDRRLQFASDLGRPAVIDSNAHRRQDRQQRQREDHRDVAGPVVAKPDDFTKELAHE